MATLDADLQSAHGMSLADYEVLVALSEAPERRLRMSDLAAVLHLSPSGLTRRLDALTRRGWVRRERCPSDRRGADARTWCARALRRSTVAAPTGEPCRRVGLDRERLARSRRASVRRAV